MEATLKLDSKGRLSIPQEVREQVGDVVTIRKTSEGYLILPGKPTNFFDEFHKVMSSEPPRTGKPENWTPQKMKAIWSRQ